MRLYRTISSMIVATALATVVTPATCHAAEVEVGALRYNLSETDKTCSVAKYATDKKYSGDIVIPATIVNDGSEYTVTSIEPYAFSSCSELTSVKMPQTLATISLRAFEYCRALTSVEFPDALTAIPNSAFEQCSALQKINLPLSLVSIGNSSFEGCRALTEIVIPNSVQTIGYTAFNMCTSVTEVWVGSGVKTIDYCAFSRLDALKAFYINCTSIPETPQTTGVFANPFQQTYGNATLYVPKGCVGTYTGPVHATTWKQCFPNIKEYDFAVTATALSLNKEEAYLTVGDSEELVATITPANATSKKLTWSSSDEKIATVTDSGIVAAIAPDECTVTVATTDGSNLSASCRIIVSIPVGIDSIEATDGIADIYNMQGIKVYSGHMDQWRNAAPAKGIYVVHTAAGSYKTVIK